MKRILAIVVVVVVALAYLAGFWPQHRQLTDAQAQSRRLQARNYRHEPSPLGRLVSDSRLFIYHANVGDRSLPGREG
jgi:hypothetical protein